MPEENTDTHKALFVNLVMMLSTSAMQQLGKIVNPLTRKAEVSLEGAQLSIDMLAMLKEKTQGHLDRDEERMLNDIIASLQMNYVDTAQSAPPRTEAKEEAPETKTPPPPAQAEASTPGDEKTPKYHKSYGES